MIPITSNPSMGALPVNASPHRRPLKILALVGLVASLGSVAIRAQQSSPPTAGDGSVLPFPPVPTASVAGPTLQESTMKWRQEPERLKPGAPNVLIVLIDDVGFGVPDTFGGEVTPRPSLGCVTRESATTRFTRPRSAPRAEPRC